MTFKDNESNENKEYVKWSRINELIKQIMTFSNNQFKL